jgi:hypothetical protein
VKKKGLEIVLIRVQNTITLMVGRLQNASTHAWIVRVDQKEEE